MITVGITELKNKLRLYLDKVRMGETVLVLDRGVPVAELVPVSEISDERIARLVRKGIVRPPKTPPPLHLLDEPPAVAGASVLEALLEERREGR